MRKFQGKRSVRNILQSWPVLIILAALTVFFTWQVIGFWAKMESTKKNRQIAEDKLLELNKSKENLSADIAKLETPEGIEESIRNKFGLVQEGEEVIVVVEDQNPDSNPEKEDEGGFFYFLKNLFK